MIDQLDPLLLGENPSEWLTRPAVQTLATRVNWDYLELARDTTVGRLPTYGYRVSADTVVASIDQKLRSEVSLPGVIVEDEEGRTQTIISRQRFFELTGTRYGVAVFMKRPISIMAKSMNTHFAMPASTSIGNAVQKALRRDSDQVYEPILIKYPNDECKLLDVYTLLLAQSRLFATLQKELKQSNDNLELRVADRTSELSTLNQRLGKEIRDKNVIEEDLKMRVHYEQVLARCADSLLTSGDDLDVIPRTLEIIIRLIQVGRIYLGKLSVDENERPIVNILYFVSSGDTSPSPLTQFELEKIGPFPKRFWEGAPLIRHFDNAVNPHTTEFLKQQHIKSMLVLPIGTPQDRFGVLGFDDPISKRLWSPNEIELLRTIARMLYAYIERYRSNLALSKARDRALRASEFKSELLAKVSHELRTPLGAILGYAQLLQLGSYGMLNDNQKEPTDLIISSTNYLNMLVDGLLDQARLDNENLVLHESPLNIKQVVEEVATRMRVLAQRKGLMFDVGISRNMPPELVADRLRLQQIMMNLIGNAVKFTEEGFVKVRIWAGKDDDWLMEISDSGPGIAEEAQQVIFDPFRQADGSPTRQHRGTGLGLSITRQLVEIMQGEIFLNSRVGVGSTFGLRLPLQVPEKVQTFG